MTQLILCSPLTALLFVGNDFRPESLTGPHSLHLLAGSGWPADTVPESRTRRTIMDVYKSDLAEVTVLSTQFSAWLRAGGRCSAS